MKKSRFTETQIIAILKQAGAGMLVKDICRKPGSAIFCFDGLGNIAAKIGYGGTSRTRTTAQSSQDDDDG